MALTKLPKNALGTGSIDDSKIEDGTVAAVEITGTLPADKLASTLDLSSKTVTLPDTSVTSDMLAGSISNAKLSNSTITFNGTSKALGTSFDLIADVDWQSVVTGDTTMVASRGYFVDTSSSAINMTLPSSASIGDTIKIKDYKATFGTNNMTIVRNGHKIQGATLNSTITTSRASLTLVYVDATKGWIYTQEYNVGNKGIAQFTEATGGTVTTSGDFKIHTFTGDGCFAVSQTGVPIGDNGGPASVDYLVVAGGGGGGGVPTTTYAGGGGGAGGYRTTFPSPNCNAGSFPISATTYPVTVGGGGAVNVKGSNSVFSTITSAGGGGAHAPQGPGPAVNVADGGSGAGGYMGEAPAGNPTRSPPGPGGTGAKGAGNFPPVSPPQGNPGGFSSQNGETAGGGGGGASEAGVDSPGPQSPIAAGRGGAGSANSITGSPVSYAGGGGGGVGYNGAPGPGTAGAASPCGTGGAGTKANNGTGGAGTANRGGGGGGAGGSYHPSYNNNGGTGGKGIVIIRYKYQ